MLRSDATGPTADDPALPVLTATRLREARIYVGLTEQDVAIALEIPVDSVSELESGKRRPTESEVRRLAGIYRKPISWLLGKDDIALRDPDALSQAIERLSATDRDQVRRFAEFLAAAGPPVGSRKPGRSGHPESDPSR